ncbi:hypothetical protein QEH42_gp146 [Microbacterium phage Pumpernickel]|uniref:Uncharacterized protein n=1 Tax=Microbacterium phage Pumpernickel TaxID=2885983 RepID=A0AAE9C2S5_9CAUD|nr:hypothetical protein QEH42_gp021 [Microbacterium phage Pumpernickel]YP_010755312.1 hypothetical protein QEH42_gp146 [Microbacterium phage Pumpernickel]UDL15812.1 hypothetical protein SEA_PUMPERNICKEL_21 [Microbacterium phage Pumpernickel]UDL16072.1 hypothetical protein SEA_PUMPERNICKEL_322 [Microbacterium phage Pumpernickel]
MDINEIAKSIAASWDYAAMPEDWNKNEFARGQLEALSYLWPHPIEDQELWFEGTWLLARQVAWDNDYDGKLAAHAADIEVNMASGIEPGDTFEFDHEQIRQMLKEALIRGGNMKIPARPAFGN